MINKSVEEWCNIISYEIQENPKKAILDSNSAILQYPEELLLYELRGSAYCFLKDYENALRDYAYVFNKRDDNWQSGLGLGLIHFELKNYHNAELYLLHILNIPLRIGHSQSYFETKDIAIDLLQHIYVLQNNMMKFFLLKIQIVLLTKYMKYELAKYIGSMLMHEDYSKLDELIGLIKKEGIWIDVFIYTTEMVFLDITKRGEQETNYKNLIKIFSEFFVKHEGEDFYVTNAILTLELMIRNYWDVVNRINKIKKVNRRVEHISMLQRAYIEILFSTKTIESNRKELNRITELINSNWMDLAEARIKNNNTKKYYDYFGRLSFPMDFMIENFENEKVRCFFSHYSYLVCSISFYISRIKEKLSIDVAKEKSNYCIYMSDNKYTNRIRDNNWKLVCCDSMNDKYEGNQLYKYFTELKVDFSNGKLQEFGRHIIDDRSEVFILSLSQEINSEKMIKKYAQNDDGSLGYCAVISNDSFDSILESEINYYSYPWIIPLYKIVYADSIEEIEDDLIKGWVIDVAELLQRIKNSFNYMCGDKALWEKLFYTLFKMMQEIAYLFKSKKNWEYEKEVRIMKCARNDDKRIEMLDVLDDYGKNLLIYNTDRKILIEKLIKLDE